MILAALVLLIPAETPRIVTRRAVPYVGVRSTESLQSIAGMFPRSMPTIQKWIGTHKLKQTDPEFLRFYHIDKDMKMDVELGVPVNRKVKGDKSVATGMIPAGRYVSLIHYGDYAGLVPPNGALQDWAIKKGLKFKMRKGLKGPEFVSRLEFYHTDPMLEPDKSKWKTEILYMIEG